jgi:hypothetical protein
MKHAIIGEGRAVVGPEAMEHALLRSWKMSLPCGI